MKKSISLFFILVILGISQVPVIFSTLTSITVYGTGDPAIDAPAVQWAVDTYDIITLHGTFSFTEDDQVSITRSVNVTGVRSNNQYLTTILGGNTTFLIDTLGNVTRARARIGEFTLTMKNTICN